MFPGWGANPGSFDYFCDCEWQGLETDYQRGIIVTHGETGTQTHIQNRKTDTEKKQIGRERNIH